MSYYPLDSVLGSRGRVKCLRRLVLYGVERTALALARDIGLSHRATTMALEALVEAGLVRVKRAGRARLYEANLKRSVNSGILLPAFRKEKDLVVGIVEEMKAAVKRAPLSVVLFGSRARGESTRGSDLDLLVVVNPLHKNRFARTAGTVAESIRDKHGISADILIETPRTLSTMKRKRAPLWNALLKEGETIYGPSLKEITR